MSFEVDPDKKIPFIKVNNVRMLDLSKKVLCDGCDENCEIDMGVKCGPVETRFNNRTLNINLVMNIGNVEMFEIPSHMWRELSVGHGKYITMAPEVTQAQFNRALELCTTCKKYKSR